MAELPSVSVIIIFYNENLSTILRTCYSVLNRSPHKLIEEILLVDDASDMEHLGKPLETYVTEHFPKVKIIRSYEKIGLIKARMLGARYAVSEVLIFLDSHCEANTNWLPPLLGT